MNSGAVFRSTGQALHVSFLMEILPSTQKGGTQIVIESLKRAHFVIESGGVHTLNSAGLSPLELRGQCAMVRGAVDHHLTEPERAAIWARFGRDARKAAGVIGLSVYIEPLVRMNDSACLRALTFSVFVPFHRGREREKGPRNDLSLRKLENKFGVPKSTLHDAREKIRAQSGALERIASTRLQDLFERTGLVDSPETAVAA